MHVVAPRAATRRTLSSRARAIACAQPCSSAPDLDRARRASYTMRREMMLAAHAHARPIARELIFDRAATVCVSSRELPAPAPGQVLVRLIVTLISPGTELRIL